MLRCLLSLLFFILAGCVFAQQHSIGVGVFSGFTVPYSLDKGMDLDSRYSARYSLKGAPIGVSLSKDLEHFGFLLTPGIITIGQDYNVVNTEGGHNGRRERDSRFFSIPFALKVHLIDLDFFRVSALATVSAAFLFDVTDRISHDLTKLNFPKNTYPFLPEGYLIEYDGVVSPMVKGTTISQVSDYNKIQAFAGIGLRADWDVSNHWRVSIDFRVNYGLLEPRTDEYLERINIYTSIYDNPGSKRDLYAQFGIGIGRFLDFDKNDKDREKKLKGTRRVLVPQKHSKPRSKSRR